MTDKNNEKDEKDERPVRAEEAPIQAAIRAWIEAGFHPVMARAMTGDNPKASLALLAEVRGSR